MGNNGGMDTRPKATSIDEYLAAFPPEVQERLTAIREIVHEVAPDAVETISYAIPTFDLNGTHLVHFAGFARHIGFYPTGSGFEGFEEDIAGYKQGRGSVQFPLTEPLPTDLIRRIVEARTAKVLGG